MPTPGEHKTVQARILAYAEAIGWTIVSREEAEQRRGFDPEVPPADRARNRSLFFDDLLDTKVREFNPRYAEEKRERDLILIDSNQKKEAHHD
jgi:type I restriction enzyme, R subunit